MHAGQGERYDPLPGVTGIPKHVWTHLSPLGRKILAASLALLVVGGIGLFLAIGPDIRSDKKERAAQQQQTEEANRAALIERLERESRPKSATSPNPAPADLPSRQQLVLRTAMLAEVRASIEADARSRVRMGELPGPILRVACEPFPRTVQGKGAETNLAERSGRFSCLAVTTDVKATSGNEASEIGHPFRARVDFVSGVYAWCKISGRPGEGSLVTKPVVKVPQECGGSTTGG